MHERELAKAITQLSQATVSLHAWLSASGLPQSISLLAHAIHELSEHRKHESACRKSHSDLVTKQDLKEMESRLKEAIAKNANVTPAIQAAATRLGDSLDKLDASVPDRKPV